MAADARSRLARHAGIQPAYHDLAGIEHVTGPETEIALLGAMGLPTAPAPAAELLADWEARARGRGLPQSYVVAANEPTTLTTADEGIAWRRWELITESGEAVAAGAPDDITLPPLPAGYHRLRLGADEVLLIAAPAHAPSVAEAAGRAPVWGITTALYGLRSARNHGIGDYEDLARTAEALAAKGADFLGVNPVHALGSHTGVISPYSPSHREFLNTRHIALDQVPEFDGAEKVRRAYAELGPEMAGLRASELVDYAGANDVAMPILRAMFEAFEAGADTTRREAYAAFRRRHGERLDTFALFEALSAVHGPDPARWPVGLEGPDTPGARAFAAASSREMAFHAYLQWLAEMQLRDAHTRARAAGMGLGLYADLAVGVRPDGAEPWSAPGLFATGAALGVPPDAFNPLGQEWGLVPLNPLALRDQGYRPLIATLGATLRHAGLIRIDHVIGLMRCFWVPTDGAPGGYVSYPLTDLLAIVRIEAARAGAVVVGEDLGVVPDGLRDALASAGLYGVQVMQFERHPDGAFRLPGDYRTGTLASIGTHDTPTLAGFWNGSDLDHRQALGQIGADGREDAERDRADTRVRLAWMLSDAHLLPDGIDAATAPAEIGAGLGIAVHRALAETRAEMVAVQLDDALLDIRQPNFPGTVDQYPNWRIRATVPVEGLADDARIAAVAEAMTAAGRGAGRLPERREA